MVHTMQFHVPMHHGVVLGKKQDKNFITEMNDWTV